MYKRQGQTVCRSAEEYQALIDRFITSLTDVGTVVVLDCHAYAGVYQSVTDFWKIAAKKYDENELVIYGLLNEPISDWLTWYEGGKVALPDGTVEESIGIPALIDIVRELSDNVVAVGGIDWAFDLSGIASEAFEKQAESRAAALGMSKEPVSYTHLTITTSPISPASTISFAAAKEASNLRIKAICKVTPFSFAVLSIISHSSTDMAIGFSQRICFPAFAAAHTISQ